MSGTDQRERAVWTSRGVRKLRRAIPADAVAGDGLGAEFYVLVKDRPESAGTAATTSDAFIRGPERAYRCRRRGIRAR